MIKRTFALILLLIGCKALEMKTGTGKLSSEDNKTLFSVGNSAVSVEEFNYVYSKSNTNNDKAYTRQDIKEYLGLFINFKLKIAEAKSRGMDTTEAFKNELNGYLSQLKQPYLSEKSVTEKLVKEAYDRYSEEIRASHILIKIDEEDTLESYQTAIRLRNKIMNGASFEEVAKKNSSDPSVKINGGDLGYFTSFQMVYPFESAAYKTKQGEISMPVRTQFGYHLIKVKDKRPSHGKVQVAHIMLKHRNDSSEVRDKIFNIFDQAVGGVAWEELVNQYSEDINSKKNNGILRSFSVGQMPLVFQEAAFSLPEIGDISDPVKTQYGWHILKCIKKEPTQSFEEMKPTISSRIGNDERSQLSERVLIKRLKDENGFSENSSTYKKIKALADSTLTQGQWNPDISTFASETLFVVGDINYTISDFVSYVTRIQKTSNYDDKKYIEILFENFKKQEVIAYEEAHLEEKYVDYRMLLNEYREGILLFELMEKEVWNKAIEDSLGLQAFYEDHKNDYLWSERADALVFSSGDTTILATIGQAIILQDTALLNKQRLYEKFNAGDSFKLQINEGLFEKGAVEVLDQCPWEKGLCEKEYAGKNHLVWIRSLEPSRQKALSEARGAVISDYQGLLEKEWIEMLKMKFIVKLDSKVLKDVYKALEKK